jgi:hypothetical protein
VLRTTGAFDNALLSSFAAVTAFDSRFTVFTLPLKTNGLILEAEPGPVPCEVVAAIYISPYKNEHMYILI